jgi:pyruvate dehydrogenase E2 component (dihydrolipoamide acetyltransferase)
MTDVIMPQMGESIAEGTVIQWYKKVGDPVERDEPLFEISTDKVDTEIPSPVAGVLAEINVREGETVPVNTVVAVIGSVAEAASAPPLVPAPATVREAAIEVEPEAPSTQPPAVSGTSAVAAEEEITAEGGPRRSPLVRRMALEHGIDLSMLSGTGQGGRITKQDVLSFLEGAKQEEALPAAEGLEAPVPPTPTPPPAAAAPPSPAKEPPLAAAPSSYSGRVEIKPMSNIRKSIAEHMIVSRRTSAHVTTVFEADVSRIVRTREELKQVFQRDEGIKLTYTPFFVSALLGALKSFPLLNSSIDGDCIVYHKDLNIGMAVALEGGLIVPVVKNADEKSFLGLARAVSDLSERARTRKLKPDDVQGGTFTVTNPGPYGGLFGTPIINQPQVAILALGGVHKRPVVVNEGIAVRSMVYLALSFDHRSIDGALADRFMADLKQRIENWDETIT